MADHRSRRRFLQLCGFSIGTGIAGCSGNSDSEATDSAIDSTRTTTRSTPASTAHTKIARSTMATRTTTETSMRTTSRNSQGTTACDPTRINDNDPLTLRYNSRDVRRCLGTLVSGSDFPGDWTAVSGTFADPHGSPFDGTSGTRVVANGGRVRLRRRYPNGIDLSGKDLSIGVNLLRGKRGTLSVELRAPNASNTLVQSRYFGASGWMRIDLGPSKSTGSPDLSNVHEIRIGFRAAGRPITLALDAFRTTPKAKRGSVLFTFDDIRRSVYENAWPVLQKLELPATIGVIPWFVGKSSARMTLDQLKTLQKAGWEMASHPHTPRQNGPLTSVSKRRRRTLIRRAKRWLLDHDFDRGANSFIWPKGKYKNTLDLVGRYHHLAFKGGTPFGTRVTDPALVPRVNGDDMKITKQAVDFAAKYNKTVTIMIHTVKANSERITPSQFKQLAHYVTNADVDVITPSQLRNRPNYQP